jgi:hypothetical protein
VGPGMTSEPVAGVAIKEEAHASHWSVSPEVNSFSWKRSALSLFNQITPKMKWNGSILPKS